MEDTKYPSSGELMGFVLDQFKADLDKLSSSVKTLENNMPSFNPNKPLDLEFETMHAVTHQAALTMELLRKEADTLKFMCDALHKKEARRANERRKA